MWVGDAAKIFRIFGPPPYTTAQPSTPQPSESQPPNPNPSEPNPSPPGGRPKPPSQNFPDPGSEPDLIEPDLYPSSCEPALPLNELSKMPDRWRLARLAPAETPEIWNLGGGPRRLVTRQPELNELSKSGAASRFRTHDPLLTRQVLYQLSYGGECQLLSVDN